MRELKSKSRKGFSLTEIITAILIIVAATGLAIPRLYDMIRRFKNDEAIQMFQVIYGEQKSYKIENGGYTSSWDSLGIEQPILKNFDPPTIYAGAGDVGCLPQDYIARVSSKDERFHPYYLYLLEDGTVDCSDQQLIPDCNASICKKMGF